jgi:deoxyribodipyrimidine photo-lyase
MKSCARQMTGAFFRQRVNSMVGGGAAVASVAAFQHGRARNEHTTREERDRHGHQGMSVFVFRRDLRVVDNTALAELMRVARGESDMEHVAPSRILYIFVFDPAQIQSRQNRYHSPPAVAFMKESLKELKEHGGCPGLRFFYGSVLAVLEAANTSALGPLRAVGFNADHTPYARRRDFEIVSWCEARNIRCIAPTCDYALVDPPAMPKPYQVFTPFYRRQLAGPEPLPPQYATQPLPRAFGAALPPMVGARELDVTEALHDPSVTPGEVRSTWVSGGRRAALTILDRIRSGAFSEYEAIRDVPGDEDGTTRLGACLKFGCVSVREAYYAATFAAGGGDQGRQHPLVRQMYWRAFYDQVCWHFPHVLCGQLLGAPNRSLRESFDGPKGPGAPSRWVQGAAARARFQAWCSGRTGFPLVDAGMRELSSSGHMHNRVRMLTACVLVKQLRIDWRLGERHFATALIDYHPAANSGGWQWAAGGGADSQPYNRVLSPWLQARRHDPACTYIHRWVSELRGVPVADVLSWDEECTRSRHSHVDYPAPIVDHRSASAAWRAFQTA